MNAIVIEAEQTRERMRRWDWRGSARVRSCRGLVEIQLPLLLFIIIIKQRRQKEVGCLRILCSITRGIWIWITGHSGVTVRFEWSVNSGASGEQFWEQSTGCPFSSIITFLALEFSQVLLHLLLSQWGQIHKSSGAQGYVKGLLWAPCKESLLHFVTRISTNKGASQSYTHYKTGYLVRYKTHLKWYELKMTFYIVWLMTPSSREMIKDTLNLLG